MRGGWPVRLGDIMPGAIERIGPKGIWLEARVRQAWTRAVGGPVAENSWVRRLRGGTLEVGVSGEAWGTEMRFLGPEIARKINAIVGGEVVREIVVQRGKRRA